MPEPLPILSGVGWIAGGLRKEMAKETMENLITKEVIG
jgi:hypothetical protein